MVQQGGLGRGLASLIPNKNKNSILSNSSHKKSAQNKNGKKGIIEKNNTLRGESISSVGEANYFGATPKAEKPKVKTSSDGKRVVNKRVKSRNVKLQKGMSLKSLPADEAGIMEVPVVEIMPNPYQPRTNFDSSKLQELADSIAEHGIIQPLVVTYSKKGGYELIAGERRLEAAKLANLETVPVVTRSASEQNKAEWALIENIQRHNLNPIEEANAYDKMQQEFGLTQEEIADKVGKSRSAIANTLRLLKLPTEIQEALARGKITEGHARTILALSDEKKQMDLFKSILKDKLNVRQVEEVTRKINVSKNYRAQRSVDPDLLEIENKIADKLNTKVKIRGIKNNGKILIDYYSEEELGQIVRKLS